MRQMKLFDTIKIKASVYFLAVASPQNEKFTVGDVLICMVAKGFIVLDLQPPRNMEMH